MTSQDSGLYAKSVLSPRVLPPSAYVLVADDDQDDQELIRDAFTDSGMPEGMVRFVNDGEELLSSLRQVKHLPLLILLDLNMPRKDGKEALEEIKMNGDLKRLPVIIFTTSDSDQDVRQCYTLGANAYLTKPARYQDLVNVLTATRHFWFEHSRILLD